MSKMFSEATESYRNDKFSFKEKPRDNKFVLQIIGKSIEVLNRDRFHSAYLPYSTYPSLSAFSKKVVDDVPGFGSARYLQRGRIENLG